MFSLVNRVVKFLSDKTFKTTGTGRWYITYNPKVISLKVYQANEDHCGCCQTTIINDKKEDKNEEYYKHFCI